MLKSFKIATLAIAFTIANAFTMGIAFAQVTTQDLIVEKKSFSMPSLTFQNGKVVKNVKIGYQTAGTLNADKSNVILITHFFSGTSHAFGKYKAEDKVAGYWDSIIGAGKAVDTNKFFVIAVDSLSNLNARAPNVITTGPSSLNPDTNKPYGLDFPVTTITDMVESQKALLESLGVTKLKAVMGASMGALQAFEWAARYPDKVEILIPVIGTGRSDAFLIGFLDLWAQPIRLDPKWKGGAYELAEQPMEGLKASLRFVTLHANHWEWANKTFNKDPADPAKNPFAEYGNRFKIETFLEQAAGGRANVSDANNFLYLVKASQSANADYSKIKARTLMLYAPTDLVFPARTVLEAANEIRKNGTKVRTVRLDGPNGHLNGLTQILPKAHEIQQFLNR